MFSAPAARPAAVVLLVSLLLSLSAPANRAAAATAFPPAISRERAEQIIRDVFLIPADYRRVRADTRTDVSTGLNVWDLQWEPPERPFRGPAPGVLASVDARTGEILQFSYFVEPPAGPGAAPADPIPSTEAQRRAEALIRRLQPREAAEVRPAAPGPSGRGFFGWGSQLRLAHTFRWERLVAGVPVQGDGFTVTIDAGSGRVTNYRFQWTRGIDFPAVAGVIDKAAAARALVDESQPLLQYVPIEPGDPRGETIPDVRLVWRFNAHQPIIDARTGKLYSPGWPAPRGFLADIPKAPATAPLRLQLRNRQPGGEISRERAEQVAREFLEAAGFTGLQLIPTQGSGSSAGSGLIERYIGVQFAVDGEGQAPGAGRSVGVEVNVATGTVDAMYDRAGFSPPPPRPNDPRPFISAAQAQEIARNLVRRAAADVAGQWVEVALGDLPREKGPPGLWLARFMRTVGGIPMMNEEISVGVDPFTSKIVQFQRRWHDVAPVGGERAVMPEAEARRILAGQPVELAYMIDRPPFFGPITPDNRPEPPRTATLVYRFGQPLGEWFGGESPLLDVETGTLIDRFGRRLGEEGALPARVRGHWAEMALSTLMDGRLIEASADFDPDGPVPRGEAARLLLIAAGKSSGGLSRSAPAADWLANAAKLGILNDPLPPPAAAADEPVRRGEFVLMLVRALGLGDLVRMPNAIEARFADAGELDPQVRNAAGIAQGLGLVRGAPGGRFGADALVSWGELATLLVRAAPRFSPGR